MEPANNNKKRPSGLHQDRSAKQALIARKTARDKILRLMEDKRIAQQYDL